MLNPSTADEVKLDPSCTRAREYAKAWGYGALIVTNLFGWRATDPKHLLIQKNPVGRGNDEAIVAAARSADLVVCAWGNHGLHNERSSQVMQLLKNQELHFLRLNSSGEPAHPLYLPSKLRPTPYRIPR
jgi:hypothetical protein